MYRVYRVLNTHVFRVLTEDVFDEYTLGRIQYRIRLLEYCTCTQVPVQLYSNTGTVLELSIRIIIPLVLNYQVQVLVQS